MVPPLKSLRNLFEGYIYTYASSDISTKRRGAKLESSRFLSAGALKERAYACVCVSVCTCVYVCIPQCASKLKIQKAHHASVYPVFVLDAERA